MAKFSSRLLLIVLLGGLANFYALAADPAAAAAPQQIAEDLAREKAIAEFTAKMKAANYPALFDQAAAEFGVPADILKGVAFTLTRWEHLTWPAGETRSPETGMPRPFGIMSLWDNEFFGHSLIQAAKLIGKDPEELKRDPLTNIRGGAALLKKLYGETPPPAGTGTNDIESWRYAMAEYVGIPEPDLKHRFALEVYEHMNKGYHQFGIEWNARPVNLEPMRAEVKGIVAVEDRKREAEMKAAGLLGEATNSIANATTVTAESLATKASREIATNQTMTNGQPLGPDRSNNSRGGIWWLVGALAMLLVGSLLTLRRRSKA